MSSARLQDTRSESKNQLYFYRLAMNNLQTIIPLVSIYPEKTKEWIEKMWYIHTMECYSVTKRNGTGSLVATNSETQARRRTEPTSLHVPVCSVTQSCQTRCDLWTEPARLLCPWHSPGKDTGMGCRALRQRIFLTQGLNLHLLRCRWILYC